MYSSKNATCRFIIVKQSLHINKNYNEKRNERGMTSEMHLMGNQNVIFRIFCHFFLLNTTLLVTYVKSKIIETQRSNALIATLKCFLQRKQIPNQNGKPTNSIKSKLIVIQVCRGGNDVGVF